MIGIMEKPTPGIAPTTKKIKTKKDKPIQMYCQVWGNSGQTLVLTASIPNQERWLKYCTQHAAQAAVYVPIDNTCENPWGWGWSY